MKQSIRTYSQNNELVSRRRKEIYMTAAKLFLKNGYQGTSMRTLAEAVGLSVAGLYYYIGTKDDIIHLIMEFTLDYEDKIIRSMQDIIKGLGTSEALEKSIKLFLESIDEIQDIHNFHNHIIASLPHEYREMLYNGQKRFVAFFEGLIRDGIEHGELEAESAELIAHNILLIAQGWANRRWFLRQRFTRGQYTRLEIEHILKSLQVQKPSGNNINEVAQSQLA